MYGHFVCFDKKILTQAKSLRGQGPLGKSRHPSPVTFRSEFRGVFFLVLGIVAQATKEHIQNQELGGMSLGESSSWSGVWGQSPQLVDGKKKPLMQNMTTLQSTPLLVGDNRALGETARRYKTGNSRLTPRRVERRR